MSSRGDRRRLQEAQRQQKRLAAQTEAACELLLARHGETDWNVEHRLQGQLRPGPPLNEKGLLQAAALAVRLAGETFDGVYTSDLQRTLQTAQAVCERRPGISLVSDALLRERFLGPLQGTTLAEARVAFSSICDGLVRPNEASAAAGVESLEELQARAAGALERIAAAHPNQRVLVVVHGGVLHAVHRKATGFDPGGRDKNCALSTLRIDATKQPAAWAVVRWGDSSHLGPNGGSTRGGNGFGGGAIGG